MSLDREASPDFNTPSFGWQLFESSPDCVKLLGRDGRVLAMNRSGRLALELDEDDPAAGRAWTSFWPPESRGEVEAALAAAVQGGGAKFAGCCLTAKGNTRWWDVVVTPIRGAGGQVEQLLAISRDITAARQVERELRAANERINDIFRQAPAFMCVLRGPEHVFEMVNDRYLQLVGRRDLVGQSVRAALPEIAGQGFIELLDGVYRTGETFTGAAMPVMLQREPGLPPEERFLDLAYIALRDADGQVTGLLAHGVDQTHRKRAEAAHLADRERLLLASEAAELGLWTWHAADGAVTWENARPYQIFGLPPEARPVDVRRFVAEFLLPEDVEEFGRCARRTLETGAHLSFQGRIRRADGALRWVEFFGRVRQAEGEAPLQVVGTVSDITARKLAEIELYESRERFAKIVHQAATGVVEMDTTGRIAFVNQKYADMLGYDPAELVGRNVLEVTAPESVQGTLDTVGKVLTDGVQAVVDKHYLRKDGSLMPVTSSVNALRGPAGEFQGVVAIVLDTTASKRAAEDLRSSEERYRTLFESMDQGFCIVEMIFDDADRPVDYRFIEMNAMFQQHTGLAGAPGRTVRELVPELDRFWIEAYGRVARSGVAERFESEARAMGRWFDVYATRIGGAGSNRVALLFSDITSRRQADITLRKLAADLAEADRRKTEFLATLAHELRNPLAPMRSALGVLRLSGDNAAAVAKVRAMMERQVGHLVHLIDDLLDIARISGGKLELKKTRVDLAEVLSSAVETSLPVIEAGRHELQLDVAPEPFPAEVDVTRVAQVVANLLNNAAKYTPPCGRIVLAMRREGGEAVISVADTGVGIPADALGSVFEMFSQVGRDVDRSQGGLGIGLSLVRRLVEMHGGSVTAASAGPGSGSTFTVRLPLAPAAHERAPAAAQDGAQAEQGGAGMRVLVVDDNVDAAVTLSMIQELSGHATRVAHDGVEAVEVARDFLPRLVFLDIGMPRMNGYDTARALRRMPGMEGAVLVALTGWGAEGDRNQSSDAGFDHHLTKPVQMGDIERILAGLAGAS